MVDRLRSEGDLEAHVEVVVLLTGVAETIVVANPAGHGRRELGSQLTKTRMKPMFDRASCHTTYRGGSSP